MEHRISNFLLYIYSINRHREMKKTTCNFSNAVVPDAVELVPRLVTCPVVVE